jgi:hypothetical protein
MKKTPRKRKSGKKMNLEDMESLNTYEPGETVEDLYSSEVEKDCFMDGDFDEESIISRVKLF